MISTSEVTHALSLYVDLRLGTIKDSRLSVESAEKVVAAAYSSALARQARIICGE